MSLQPPKIDQRTYQDIVNQTEELAKKFTQWRPRADGKPDAGMAMIRIFGRMAALVSDRLNQVPDKNFLAFLDLIGTHLLPPQPAKVPLTFSLAQGSPVDALVPAHTQVAAPPAEGQEEVVFETDRELVVTTAQLQAVFVREPEKDKYSDRTLQATGKKDAAFEAFAGEQPIEHCLYLACDELFNLPGNKTITLKFNTPEATSLATLPITWSYWDGSWQVLNPTVNLLEGEMQVVIPNLPVLTKQFINGIEAGWLKASLNQSLLDEDANKETTQLKVKDVRAFMAADSTIRLAAGSSNQEDCKIISVDSQDKTLTLETALKYSHPKESSICLSKLPTINHITVRAEITKNDLTPDFCFFNTVPIDLSKDFYPFGEQPRFNDTLYIASKEAFARSNANVTLTVTLSENLFVNTDGSVEIAWEVWNGQNWQKLETNSTTLSGEPITNSKNLPTNFTGNGKVTLTLSQANFQTTVNGETNYWLRARIVKGNFGAHLSQTTTIAVLTEDSKTRKELTVNSVRGFMPNDRVQIVSGGQNPESCQIESSDNKTNKLTLKTELRQTYLRGTSVMLLSDSVLGPPSVKSLNLSYRYEASRSISACCAYNDFHYAENSVVLQSFQPFKATTDREQTLYLGFDKPFANRPTTLFAQVEPPQPKEVASQLQTIDTKPVQLVWEYANPAGWSRLGVKDETSAFAERGVIQFIGPTDFIKTSEFGQELYWLRVRWQEGQFRIPPRLRRLLTNTMWATQATTLLDEILGSSDGNPKQIFGTVHKPVLKGQQLEVQEANIPSPEEHAVIKLLEGDDAVNIVRDETGQIEAVWVRWHNVRDFYGSGPRDRHYVLDRLTGEVQFGDGQYGMVPPQGRNNIRLSQYQTGGGTQGNLAANTVVQLKTTVPYVEKVTNLEAASGGAEQESLEQVKERGPKFLRHRGRAVTWQDFEDLAYEASPNVARAKAIAPSFDPLDLDLWIKDPKAPNLDQHKTPHDAGQIRMLIVPRSQARQPVPSLALIDWVKAYVRERCDPSVNLQVTGPEWQAVSVTAEVVPVSLEKADAVRSAVVQHLENFLHPLSGGKKGQGWALGRLPQQSDLYAVIESIPGVDHVQSLTIEPDLEELSPEKLVYSGTHTVTSILPEEGA